MNQKERAIVVFILGLVAVLVAFDLVTDSRDGVLLGHVFVEGGIGLAALFGAFYVLRGAYDLRHRLEDEKSRFAAFRKESEVWRAESRKYVEGLSKAIDAQLSSWKLSTAEKEVAFLLLKGLSLKEIADIRQTSEKTARTQSMAVYSKSGLAGRSELSAFFLEDLLLPKE